MVHEVELLEDSESDWELFQDYAKSSVDPKKSSLLINSSQTEYKEKKLGFLGSQFDELNLRVKGKI